MYFNLNDIYQKLVTEMVKKIIYFILAIIVIIIAVQSCKTYYFRRNYSDANTLLHKTENLRTKIFLKAHLKNGDICILEDSWQIDTTSNILTGMGVQYNFNRLVVNEGMLSIPIDSVDIFETNDKLDNPEAIRTVAIMLLSAVNTGLSLFCIMNPKACFGSCPTFYMDEFADFHSSDAEGFTNAIAPSMEYYDIDALNNPKITNNTFELFMRNEALETHCVNEVKLLAFPRKNGERVYHTNNDEFYLCEDNLLLNRALSDEGDITSLLKSSDMKERFSLSDENNLKSKEEIILTFKNVQNSNQLGLILNFRQTLMTTILFYDALGYMGDNVSDVFAMLERDEKIRNEFDATTKELGPIEIYAWNDSNNKWEYQNSFSETGPIAINKQIIPLSYHSNSSNVKLKLVLNKGLWRIDYAALTNIKRKVNPIEITPYKIYNKGVPDDKAFVNINNPDEYLISMPGDEYKFMFTLPKQNEDYELFLYSKGYYLEWFRNDWLKEKDLDKLKLMVREPLEYLKNEAKNFKAYETQMEQEFWNSRIDTKSWSKDEN